MGWVRPALHCGEELLNVFMGVTYYQEAEDDLLKHIKCSEQAEESKDVSIFVLSIAIISLQIKGEVEVSLGHKSLGDC